MITKEELFIRVEWMSVTDNLLECPETTDVKSDENDNAHDDNDDLDWGRE